MTSKKLKTIDEHNWLVEEPQRASSNKTGVSCPKCNRELLYIDKTILLSFPPKRAVVCEKCNYLTSILC